MKLAEALQQRADLQAYINGLRDRLSGAATVQEGEEPPENPEKLMCELDEKISALEIMIQRINKTNSSVYSNGVTITDLLAKRDCLKLKLSVYNSFSAEAGHLVHRATRTEIKIVSTVNVAKLRERINEISAEMRKTDSEIQMLNWSTELI